MTGDFGEIWSVIGMGVRGRYGTGEPVPLSKTNTGILAFDFAQARMTSKNRQRQGQKQIPFGNDKQKGKYNSRFPSGMTNKEARATADSLRE